MYERNDAIPMAELEDGAIYEVFSRNLAVGVWNAEKQGFNGLREKFGDRYIFMEYNWETGPPFGTAHGMRKLDVELPEDIPNLSYLGSFCQACDKPVVSRGPGEVERQGGMTYVQCIGWTHVADEDKAACEREGEYMSYAKGNKALVDLLDPLDQKIRAEREAQFQADMEERRRAKLIDNGGKIDN